MIRDESNPRHVLGCDRSLMVSAAPASETIQREQIFPELVELEHLLGDLPNDEALFAAWAAHESQMGRFRRDVIGGDIVGDNVWDMLLLLAARKGMDQSVSVGELAFQCNGSYSTGLRWVGILADRGLVCVTGADIDPLANIAVLTKMGVDVVQQCLRQQMSNTVTALINLQKSIGYSVAVEN